MSSRLEIFPVPGLPLVKPGDDLAELIAGAMAEMGLALTDQDIVVIAQKVVSKAEDRFVRLDEVEPSERALELAKITGKPASLVELILADSREIVRVRRDLLVVEHRLGFISANAGIDHSNVSETEGVVLRLPEDPDASARAIRRRLAELTGANGPVLIIDSHGRPWRLGTAGVTIGLSGLAPVLDLRGTPDLFGAPLRYTDVGLADQIAAAATLVMGQAAEACPVVVVRGMPFTPNDAARAADVLRPKGMDVFR